MPHHRHRRPANALFARISNEQAHRLDRAAFQLGIAKQEVVSRLLERYVDPDSPDLPSRLGVEDAADQRRRVTVETFDAGGLAVGHHHFRPREPEVLTLEEVAELLAVDADVVRELAERGELPGRRLGDQWRFARSGVLRWLEPARSAGPSGSEQAGPQPSAGAPPSGPLGPSETSERER